MKLSIDKKIWRFLALIFFFSWLYLLLKYHFYNGHYVKIVDVMYTRDGGKIEGDYSFVSHKGNEYSYTDPVTGETSYNKEYDSFK